MDANVHGSFSFLSYHLIYFLWFNSIPAPWISLLAFVCGIIPDFDGIYWQIKGNTYDNTFQHHLKFWSHWPIAFLPLVILFLISLMTNFYPEYILLPLVGIYGHFLADSACCGDGMMWGKKPWKKDQFAPFINLFAKKTDGYHGMYWEFRWRQTKMFKIGLLMSSVSIALIISFWIGMGGFNFPYFSLLVIYIVILVISFKSIPEEFQKEPPNGRYDDYRRDPEYVGWMQKYNFHFDQNHFVKKSK